MTKTGWCKAPYFEKDREKEKGRPHGVTNVSRTLCCSPLIPMYVQMYILQGLSEKKKKKPIYKYL